MHSPALAATSGPCILGLCRGGWKGVAEGLEGTGVDVLGPHSPWARLCDQCSRKCGAVSVLLFLGMVGHREASSTFFGSRKSTKLTHRRSSSVESNAAHALMDLIQLAPGR